MTRERVVFLAAVGIIAVHIVDDSFVNPQPGTSAGDHLVSGLVPLAALGGAVVAYLRSRDGVRGTIALLLGLFGIVVSSEGWYYTINVGPSGDDYTGLLVLPAALVLLGLGVVVLWRSRHLDTSRWRRYLRRGGIGVVGFVLVMFVIAPFMMTYAYTHISRAEPPTLDLGGADYSDVSFETSDGLTLTGWYIPSKNGAAVIAWAGRSHAQNPARFLAADGYGVLLYDRRGEAESEGDPNALGWDRATDIEAGIAFLKTQPDVDPERIGGIGFSVGGEMLLEAAAESDDLKAVVSEGAGIRSYKEGLELDGANRWLQFPVWASATLGIAIFANSTPPANLKDLVQEISPRPVFLIYAEQGQGGEELSAEYYNVAGDPKQVWQTESEHVSGYYVDPDEYERRVVEFFNNALL